MLLNNQHVVARKLLDAGFMFEHSDLDAAIAAVLGTPRPATPALKTY
jgi:NAD dependent epimerase/dehydratase family enzyme